MPIACWLFWNIPEPLGLAFRSQDFPEVPGSFAQGTLPLLLLLAVAPPSPLLFNLLFSQSSQLHMLEKAPPTCPSPPDPQCLLDALEHPMFTFLALITHS